MKKLPLLVMGGLVIASGMFLCVRRPSKMTAAERLSLRAIALRQGWDPVAYLRQEEICQRWESGDIRPADVEDFLNLLATPAKSQSQRINRISETHALTHLKRTMYRSRAIAATRAILADERRRPEAVVGTMRNLLYVSLARIGDPNWREDLRQDLESFPPGEARENMLRTLQKYGSTTSKSGAARSTP